MMWDEEGGGERERGACSASLYSTPIALQVSRQKTP